jgi:hypothetical protein
MSEALYAVAGVTLGLFGTLLLEVTRARYAVRRERRAELRSACVDFANAISRMRQISYDRDAIGPDPDLTGRMRQAYGEGRAAYERLRLVTDSASAQKEARHALQAALWFWRDVQGESPPAVPGQRTSIQQLEDRLSALYIEVRKELGVPKPSEVFTEPEELRNLPEKDTQSGSSSS